MLKGRLYLNSKWVIKYLMNDFKEIELHPDDVKYVEMFKDMSGGFMYNNMEVEFMIVFDDLGVYATLNKKREIHSSLKEIDRLLSIRTNLAYQANIEDNMNDNIFIMETLKDILVILNFK